MDGCRSVMVSQTEREGELKYRCVQMGCVQGAVFAPEPSFKTLIW